MGIDFNALGDKHKKLEEISSTNLIPEVPTIARLDGRAFHTLTKHAKKPYDTDFIKCMEETTKSLVHHFNADIGYVQSDEITLVWKNLDMFDLRVQKLCSVLASHCSVIFNRYFVNTSLSSHSLVIPTFDCRIWQVPTLQLAAENLMWREMDASRNSVNMLAHSVFKQSELQHLKTKQRIQLLEEHGHFWNLLDANLKRGSYFKRTTTQKWLTPDELQKIPPQYRPDKPISRTTVERQIFPRLTTLEDLTSIFN